jgi:hypothetical protein
VVTRQNTPKERPFSGRQAVRLWNVGAPEVRISQRILFHLGRFQQGFTVGSITVSQSKSIRTMPINLSLKRVNRALEQLDIKIILKQQ